MRSRLKPIGRLLPYLAILAMVSCLLEPNREPPTEVEHYLSLVVPDSLAVYDTVRVRLIRDGDTVETLWNAPLPDTDSLQRLRAETYDGGRIDVLIEGLRQGDIQYRILVRVMGGGGAHEVERLPLPPDRFPPILTLNGPDSLRLLAGEAYEDSGATCRDVRDGDLDVETEGSVPIYAAGLHILVYRCADAAGNQADSLLRKVRIELPPDTVPPRLTLRGEDSLALHVGSVYADSGATCRDGRDGDLEPTVEGSVNTESPGTFTLTYRCADAAGNKADIVIRRVRIELPPDTVPPRLTLRGEDSLTIHLGSVYADSGATCRDDRDGDIEPTVEGAVKIDSLGVNTLVYRCADAAGNEADSVVRKVRIELPPDTVPPRITLRGEDSITIHQGSIYVDSGADCQDDRDGGVEPTVEGAVKMDSLGTYTMVYRCADAAGNQADAVSRRVRVVLPPDTVPPVISLSGEDTVAIAQDSSFRDPGSRCEDDRDGTRPVIRSGLVDSASPGLYMLRYDCEDEAGNEAATVRRAVRVEAPPDTTPAVLALKGPTEIEVWAGGTLSDTGAACLHPVRGGLPVATEGRAVLDTPGVYTLRYTCEVRPGRIQAVSQDVRVKPILTEIPILKEAEIDTFNNTHHNMGCNASGAFLPSEGNEHVILMKFDLSQVKVEGLKSAEVVFQTFGYGAWTGNPVTATLHVYRVRSAWTEGTGNWFWHAGGWRNNGANIFKHYPLSDSVKAISTDPAAGNGVTGAQKSLVRKSNMISMGTRQVTVAYTSEEAYHPVPSGFTPPKELLTPLSVDFTDYVKTVPADQDFGFVIVVEDLAPPMYISWLTKEAGDGSFGAKLVLRY